MPLLKAIDLNLRHFSLDQPGRRTLALHGFLGSGQDFEAIEGRWGVPLLAPDLLGHGASPLPDLAPEQGFDAQMAALCALVDGLSGPLNLLGYSMGGRLALHLLHARPQRFERVVLIGSSPGLSDPVDRAQRRAADQALAQLALAEGALAFAEIWAKQPLMRTQARIPSPWREGWRARRALASPQGLAWSLEALGTGVLPSLWDTLPTLPGPALLLAGQDDPKFVALHRQMAELWRHARCVELPGAGHCAHLEALDACGLVLAEFLASNRLPHRMPPSPS